MIATWFKSFHLWDHASFKLVIFTKLFDVKNWRRIVAVNTLAIRNLQLLKIGL